MIDLPMRDVARADMILRREPTVPGVSPLWGRATDAIHEENPILARVKGATHEEIPVLRREADPVREEIPLL